MGLTVTRKFGQRLFIGEQICVTVTGIDRGKVRLLIEAPRDVIITREELLTPKQEPEATGS